MAKNLDEYRRKRDFAKTPEPTGDGDGDAASAPRFVIQEHHARRLHWDLRLEHDGVAASWAIPNGLPPSPGENRLAVHTEDHPLEYLDFEGDIPEGYGAGTMKIWDRGTYELLKWEPRKVEVHLHGERARGRYALFPIKGDTDWMIHRMDPPEDADRRPMPERLVPMLAKLAPLPPDQERWAFEIKWDGVRAIAYSQPGRIRLESRNLNDITGGYPELRALNRALSHHEAVLDGEIVAFDDDGKPSFQRLQQRMHVRGERQVKRLAESVPVVYVIFDLLWLDGHDLMALPYFERRERLEALGLEGPYWRVAANYPGTGDALLAATREQGLEGVIAKRLDCPYEPGRRGGTWLKVKNVARQELVIGGWLPGEGRRRDRIGALTVGYWSHPPAGAFRYAGKVGTGFTEAELDRLAKLLAPLERGDSPFSGRQPPKGTVYVEPCLVAEIEYTEWTSGGTVRHPSYKGIRTDKEPREVVREALEPEADHDPEAPPVWPGVQALAAAHGGMKGRDNAVEVEIEGRALRLTNLDKVLYPQTGFTKGDVIDYLARIAAVLLPHLRGRPLTLKRYPNGVDGGHFFEKNCPKHRPEWVPVAPVWSSRKDGEIDFCLACDVPTLVWLGNLADLELHTSLSLAAAIERPTMMVFDLDPGPPATIVECSDVALTLRGMFEQLGLQVFPKTSGSKGMQLYVPLNTDHVTYDDTKSFALAVAETLETGRPDLVVSRMTKTLRPGKVFIDWSQNDEHKTTVCVYSLRAKERPTVSTPITWEEVAACRDSGDPDTLVFDSAQVLRRAEEQGDLFAPVLSLVQELPAG